jgi:hypothetical protein
MPDTPNPLQAGYSPEQRVSMPFWYQPPDESGGMVAPR